MGKRRNTEITDVERERVAFAAAMLRRTLEDVEGACRVLSHAQVTHTVSAALCSINNFHKVANEVGV